MNTTTHLSDHVDVFLGTVFLFLLYVFVGYSSNSVVVVACALLFLFGKNKRGGRFDIFVLPGLFTCYIAILWASSLYVNSDVLVDEFLLAKQYFWRSRKLLLAFAYHIVIIALFRGKRPALVRAIGWVLWVNVGFWWIQTLVSYVTGEYLDPLKMLGIREQKPQAYIFKGTGINKELFFRPTGFFNEPGTYGSTVILLLILHYAIHRKIKAIHFATLASMALTLSAFSIIGAVAFCAMLVLERMRKGSLKARVVFLSVAGVCVYLLLPALIMYIQLRFYKGSYDGGIGFRLTGIDDWLSLSTPRLILGSGYGMMDIDFTFLEGMGLFSVLIFTYGIFAVPIAVFFRAYCRTNTVFAYFAIAFLMRLELNYYPLLTTLACLYLLTDCEHEKDSGNAQRRYLDGGLRRSRS